MGCDPWNELAVMRLLAIKQRPVEKGLILVAASIQQLGPLFDRLTTKQRVTLGNSWPGATTWLLPDSDKLLPSWLKGSHNSVAIRVSAHPLVKELCQSFEGMIVSTSANLAGKPEFRSRLKLQRLLGDKLDYILPGQLGLKTKPSTIRDLVSGKVLR